MRVKEAAERGNLRKEQTAHGDEVEQYRESEGPKASTSERAVKAKKTKDVNVVAAARAAANIDTELLKSESEIQQLKGPACDAKIRAWAQVPSIKFTNGCVWPRHKFPKGTGANGSLKVTEKREALNAVIQLYVEMDKAR